MATTYCTTTDVINRAAKYAGGYQPTVTAAQLTDLIVEASEYTRNEFSMNYDAAVIDAYDPDFPEVIVSATAIVAALWIYQRFGALNTSVDARTIEALESELANVCRRIRYSTLYDTTDTEVPRLAIPTVADNATYTGIEGVLDEPRY